MYTRGITAAPMHDGRRKTVPSAMVQIVSGTYAGVIGRCTSVRDGRVGIIIGSHEVFLSIAVVEVVRPDKNGFVTPDILAQLSL